MKQSMNPQVSRRSNVIWKMLMAAGVAGCLLGNLAYVNTAYAHTSVQGNDEKREVMRAYFPNIQAARSIAHSDFETLESKYELGYVIVNASASDVKELRARGFRLQADNNWRQQQLSHARNYARRSLSTQAFVGIPNYSCYPKVEEVFTEADALISAKPSLASWTTIGSSWEKSRGVGGFDLKVLKLTNSATNSTAGKKPILFIQSGIHAREYATTPLVLEFAKKLVNGHGSDADMTWILDHHEVHLLLVTNPDGRKKAETGLLWRKNTNTTYCGATSNSRGADLNRNFSFGWNSTGGRGSSGTACNDTYRGPTAGSEPEVQAIERYVRSIWPDRRGPNRDDAAPSDTNGIHLDIHSHGRLLLWPWGTAGSFSKNDNQLATLGRKFSFFNGHTPQRSLDLYETDGTSDGPSYGELGVAAFTFELGTAFFEQCSYYNSTILPGNLPALVYAAKVVRAPYVTPAGPDALTVATVGTSGTVTLNASIDDTRYSRSNGTEPTQNIAAAEYYIDTPPWAAGATAFPMSAADGAFNSGIEKVTANINTSNLSAGKHIVYVRGKDTAGNWGAVSATFLNVGGVPGSAPVAAFDSLASGLTVNFTNRSTDDGAIVGYSWNFGDGNSSTLANPTHHYAANGTYTVKLTVSDNDSMSGTINKSVTVADDAQLLTNNQTVTNISVATNAWRYYKLNVPTGAKNLSITTSGGTGDLDLFTQLAKKPTSTMYSCKKEGSTNAETCTASAPAAGMWYIGLFGYSSASGASLKVTYTP